MDEDEECLHGNSSLNSYLQNLGFSNVQITKDEGASPANKFKLPVGKSKFPLGAIDKNVIDQVEKIISTRLVFEEDVSVVEIILSNFTVVNYGIIKIMFQDLTAVVVILVGLYLYFVIGYYALVIISTYYAYKCADYFNRKSFVKIQLERQIKILQNSTSLLTKSFDFINAKHDRFLRFIGHDSVLPCGEDVVNFNFYSKFRSDFTSWVNEMIKIIVSSTQDLIKQVPLIDYADTPEYLCNNFENYNGSDDPSKVYMLYLLVQSEFLRRIILSLIPNINLSPKGNNYKKLYKILNKACGDLTKVKKKLERSFGCAFYEGFRDGYELKLPKMEIAPDSQYRKELILSIHNTANIFMKLFMKCRIIQESIVSDKIPDCVEPELITLQSAINDCQRNIEYNLILLKKANAVLSNVKQESVREESTNKEHQKNIENSSGEKANTESDNVKQEMVKLEEEKFEISNDNMEKIQVRYTDLDCVIEDDIFEAYVSNETKNTDFNPDDWDLDEVLKNKLKKEFSQNVMKELKSRLVERAKNWKKRETIVLKKKGLVNKDNKPKEVEDETEGIEKNVKTYEEISIEKEEETCENSENQEIINKLFGCHLVAPESVDKDNVILADQLETYSQHCVGGITKEFLKDLSETRKLIFTSPAPEEEFCLCTSDEEQSDTENY